RLEEAAEHGQAVALPNPGQAGMVGQFLVQVVAQEPPDAPSIGRAPYQLPLGAESLEEHHQLELEVDSRIDGRSPAFLVGTAGQVADESQVQLGLKMAVEVVGRDQLL